MVYKFEMSHVIEQNIREFQNDVDQRLKQSTDILEEVIESNKTTAERYATMNEAATGLENDAQFIATTNASIQEYCNQVDEIHAQTKRLEQLVSEMDEWSRELSVKMKRL